MKVARNEKLLKPTARSSGRNVQAGQNQTTHRRHRRADRTKSQQCTGGTGVREGLQPQRTGKTEPNCAQAAQDCSCRSTGSSASATYMQNRTKSRTGGTPQDCGRKVHTHAAKRAIEWATTRLRVERARLADRFRVCLDLSCTFCGEETHFFTPRGVFFYVREFKMI